MCIRDRKKSTYVGVCGPYDAYSEQYNWVTPRYLAIDQGTIVPMIENYKTQFLWKLFTVSYTHLDVYKRQILHHLVFQVVQMLL